MKQRSSTSISRRGGVAVTALASLCVLVGAASGAQAAPGIANISQGSSNSTGVKCVQRGVDDWANRTHQGWPLAVDGAFGHNTLVWVQRFQRASFGDAGVDGIVGPRTGDSILANLNGDSTWRRDCYAHIPSTHR